MKTFRDLLNALKTLDDAQLDSDLTWHDTAVDEFYPIENFSLVTNLGEHDTDVLDPGHPFFNV